MEKRKLRLIHDAKHEAGKAAERGIDEAPALGDVGSGGADLGIDSEQTPPFEGGGQPNLHISGASSPGASLSEPLGVSGADVGGAHGTEPVHLAGEEDADGKDSGRKVFPADASGT